MAHDLSWCSTMHPSLPGGACMCQGYEDGWRPVAFASRKFTPAEQNYAVGEKELRCLVWITTEEWRHILYGLPSYRLCGDHQPLTTLLEPGRPLSKRQMRWVEQLQEHCVPTMEYVPGLLLPVPDALSRRWDHEEQAALDQRQYLLDCEAERSRRELAGTPACMGGESTRWMDRHLGGTRGKARGH